MRWILLLLVVLTSCTPNPQAEDEFVIGAVLSLSGDFAFIGEEMRRGIILGVEQANSQGQSIRVIFEDDGIAEAAKAVSAAQKLLNVDGVDAGIVTMVTDAKPIAPLFEEEQRPLMVLFDTTDDLRQNEWTYSIGFSVELAGAKMAEFAYEKLGIREVGLVGHHDEWSETISRSFKERFISLGGTVVFEDRYLVDETDYRASLVKDVDAFYVPLIPLANHHFFDQKKELGIDSVILTGDTFVPEVWELSPEGSEGVYFTNIFPTTGPRAFNLQERYLEKYAEKPIAFPFVQMGYDAIMVYAQTLESSDVKAELDSGKEFVVSGLPVVFDDDGMASRTQNIYNLVDGEDILVD